MDRKKSPGIGMEKNSQRKGQTRKDVIPESRAGYLGVWAWPGASHTAGK
jgi:hypothetical protein